MTTEPILDPATLDGLISIGGKSFACQMIDLFFSYVPQKLAEARAAEQAGDVVGIKNAVHPIKSSANNLGTVVVKRLATQIELLAIANDGAAIPPLLTQLETAYAEAKASLSAIRETMQAPGA